MKRALCASVVFVAFAALTGCGGSLSNEDIAFVYALPSSESLKAHLPDETGTTSSGLQQRKSGLALGDPSDAYSQTKKGGDDLNAGLQKILSAIDFVRTQPPSKRKTNYREWGPWTDQNDSTRQLRIVITYFPGEGEHYEWTIDSKAKTEPESEWFQAITGSYLPSADVRQGQGSLKFDAVKARAAHKLGPTDDGKLKLLEIDYDTASDPVAIDLIIDATDAHLDYSYRRKSDGSGDLTFDLSANWVPASFMTEQLETLWVTSNWAKDGAGRADYHVYGGNTPTDANGTHLTKDTALNGGEECWDANFRVSYHRNKFNAAEDLGAETSCAVADPDGTGADD